MEGLTDPFHLPLHRIPGIGLQREHDRVVEGVEANGKASRHENISCQHHCLIPQLVQWSYSNFISILGM